MSVFENIKTIAFEEAIKTYKDYEYYLIYRISEVVFGETEELEELKLNELQEAYFFNHVGQMHLYAEEGIYSAQVICDDDKNQNHCVNKKYALADRFKFSGYNSLLVKEYIDFDEDGQSYVAYTRLAGLE